MMRKMGFVFIANVFKLEGPDVDQFTSQPCFRDPAAFGMEPKPLSLDSGQLFFHSSFCFLLLFF